MADFDLKVASQTPRHMCIQGVLNVDREVVYLVSDDDFTAGVMYKKAAILFDVSNILLGDSLVSGDRAVVCGQVSFDPRCLSAYNDPNIKYVCTPVRLPVKVKEISVLRTLDVK